MRSRRFIPNVWGYLSKSQVSAAVKSLEKQGFIRKQHTGSFSVFMTLILGIKFIVKPVMTTKEAMNVVDKKKRLVQSIVCGAGVGFICGFVGAGGGMMMLLVLTSILGYELKTAVGTSVFIMTFTALTGSVSHLAIGGLPDLWCLVFCIASTLLWARIAAKFANKASAAAFEPGNRHCSCCSGGGDLWI